jgi:hypothetical protein
MGTVRTVEISVEIIWGDLAQARHLTGPDVKVTIAGNTGGRGAMAGFSSNTGDQQYSTRVEGAHRSASAVSLMGAA